MVLREPIIQGRRQEKRLARVVTTEPLTSPPQPSLSKAHPRDPPQKAPHHHSCLPYPHSRRTQPKTREPTPPPETTPSAISQPMRSPHQQILTHAPRVSRGRCPCVDRQACMSPTRPEGERTPSRAEDRRRGSRHPRPPERCDGWRSRRRDGALEPSAG